MQPDETWLRLPAGFPAIVALTDLDGALTWIHGAPGDRWQAPIGPTEYIAGLFTRAGTIFLETHVLPTLRRDGRVSEIYLPLRAADGGEAPCLINASLLDGPSGPCCLWLFFLTNERVRFERELIEARRASQDLAARLSATVLELNDANAKLRLIAEDAGMRNRELDELAQTDPLTGLGNRRALHSAFDRWLRDGATSEMTPRAALLMVDADHFKQVNDQWGHDVGDTVLIGIAEALSHSVRRSDCAVRLGGEEFAVWLPGASREVAERVAEDIHAGMKKVRPAADSAPVTISIGIAVHSNQFVLSDLDALIKRSDQAMYAAKAAGRNCTRFD